MGIRMVSVSVSVRDNERARFGLETTVIPNWYDSGRFRPPAPDRDIPPAGRSGFPTTHSPS
jgi:hypothetical protein